MSRYVYMYGRRALNGVNMAGWREEDRGAGGGEKIGRKEKDDTLYVKCLLLLTNRTTSKAQCND